MNGSFCFIQIIVFPWKFFVLLYTLFSIYTIFFFNINGLVQSWNFFWVYNWVSAKYHVKGTAWKRYTSKAFITLHFTQLLCINIHNIYLYIKYVRFLYSNCLLLKIRYWFHVHYSCAEQKKKKQKLHPLENVPSGQCK